MAFPKAKRILSKSKKEEPKKEESKKEESEKEESEKEETMKEEPKHKLISARLLYTFKAECSPNMNLLKVLCFLFCRMNHLMQPFYVFLVIRDR